MKKAILSDGTQKPNKFWMVIDRGLGKSIVELIMPEKYKEISLLGLKISLKLARLLLLIKPWKLLR
jgi:hypothetical protein